MGLARLYKMTNKMKAICWFHLIEEGERSLAGQFVKSSIWFPTVTNQEHLWSSKARHEDIAIETIQMSPNFNVLNINHVQKP